MNPILNIGVDAARKAAKIIVRAVDRLDTIKITPKQNQDFVSDIDVKAEQEIIHTIHKAYPNHAILAEESGKTGEDEHVWIIDPIDGTTNFIHGIPHFAISIAFAYKGTIEQAVIYDPIRDELFTASKGRGSRLNNKRIRVSQLNTLDGSLIGTGFPFKNAKLLPTYLRTFYAFSLPSAGIRRAGSAALDLAYVAAGRLDGFWEFSLNPWDIAAGTLLIKEAGGLISDFAGNENYLDCSNIVAGNPKIYKEMLQIISNANTA